MMVTGAGNGMTIISQEYIELIQKNMSFSLCKDANEGIKQRLLSHMKQSDYLSNIDHYNTQILNSCCDTHFKNCTDMKYMMTSEQKYEAGRILGLDIVDMLLEPEKALSNYPLWNNGQKIQNNDAIQYLPLCHILTKKMIKKYGFEDIEATQDYSYQEIFEYLSKLDHELTCLNKMVKLKNHLCPFKLILLQASKTGDSCFHQKTQQMFIAKNSETFVHEWFHYFDYTAGMGAYATHFWKDTEDKFPQTYLEAQQLDKKHDTEYWSSYHEFWARNFESYFFEKINLKNKYKLLHFMVGVSSHILERQYPKVELNQVIEYLDKKMPFLISKYKQHRQIEDKNILKVFRDSILDFSLNKVNKKISM